MQNRAIKSLSDTALTARMQHLIDDKKLEQSSGDQCVYRGALVQATLNLGVNFELEAAKRSFIDIEVARKNSLN